MASFQAIGNQSAGAASVAVAWPAHAVDDLGIMVIETGGEGTTLAVPSGWTAVTGSPVTDVATTAGSKLQVWYKFATSAAEANVNTGDSGDHQVARIVTFRGVNKTTPFDVTPVTATKTTASTTVTWNTITTATDNALIVLLATRPDDSTSVTAFSNPVNANLTTLTERGEAGTNAGHGGGFVVVTGTKATAGAVGTTTCTGPNTTNAEMVIALRPAPAAQTLTPDLYTNDQTFHNPTVTPGAVALTPALYTNDETFYSPDVTQGGGAQALTASLYTNEQTFYGPTVTRSNALLPSLYTNDQTFYAPAVSSSATLTPGLYSNAQTFYGPTASAFNTLAPGLYTGSQTFYSAVVSQTGGVQTLLPDLYENAPVFYAPTVGRGAVNLAPSLYSNEQTLYAPSVAAGAVTLAPSLYTGAQTFYAAAVTQGGTTQALVCDDYVASDYVEGGFVAFTAFGQSVFFGAEITAPRVAGGYDDDKPKRKRRFVVERNGKLVVYASQAAALQALEDAPEAAQEPAQEADQPEVVDLPALQAYAELAGRLEDYTAAYNSRHFEQLMALFDQMREQLDEEDIEMLLLAV